MAKILANRRSIKKAQIKIFFPLIPPFLVSSISGFIFHLTVMRLKRIFTARKLKKVQFELILL